jgi:N-acyl-phosphatidylethanolamine-hydrolysing phospholipase D
MHTVAPRVRTPRFLLAESSHLEVSDWASPHSPPSPLHPRYTNPWSHRRHGLWDVIRWKLGLGPREAPVVKSSACDTPAPWQELAPPTIASPPPSGWRVVWLGHASFLLQGCGVSLLIDPIFSRHCAPFPLPGLRRTVPLPCRLSDLPPIDAVLLTHSHYDHLDLPTLRALGRHTRLITAAGHGSWLRKMGYTAVTELPWHESCEPFPDVRIISTPAQHFTARSLRDTNRAHWCGWRIESSHGSLWHAGDSGYCPAFREIGERYGSVDLGMIPIGAYQPRWVMKSMHMNPEEAVRVFVETRCRRALAMHWGTFRLTDEPLGEPPQRLERALQFSGIDTDAFMAGTIGKAIEFPSPILT